MQLSLPQLTGHKRICRTKVSQNARWLLVNRGSLIPNWGFRGWGSNCHRPAVSVYKRKQTPLLQMLKGHKENILALLNSGAASERKSVEARAHWYLSPAGQLICCARCLKGRCCNSPQELYFSSYPGLADWSSERSAKTFPSASISSTKEPHQAVSLQWDTSQYASATRTSTTLPACITVSTVHLCTPPTYSALQMANGPLTLGNMNRR